MAYGKNYNYNNLYRDSDQDESYNYEDSNIDIEESLEESDNYNFYNHISKKEHEKVQTNINKYNLNNPEYKINSNTYNHTFGTGKGFSTSNEKENNSYKFDISKVPSKKKDPYSISINEKTNVSNSIFKKNIDSKNSTAGFGNNKLSGTYSNTKLNNKINNNKTDYTNKKKKKNNFDEILEAQLNNDEELKDSYSDKFDKELLDSSSNNSSMYKKIKNNNNISYNKKSKSNSLVDCNSSNTKRFINNINNSNNDIKKNNNDNIDKSKINITLDNKFNTSSEIVSKNNDKSHTHEELIKSETLKIKTSYVSNENISNNISSRNVVENNNKSTVSKLNNTKSVSESNYGQFDSILSKHNTSSNNKISYLDKKISPLPNKKFMKSNSKSIDKSLTDKSIINKNSNINISNLLSNDNDKSDLLNNTKKNNSFDNNTYGNFDDINSSQIQNNNSFKSKTSIKEALIKNKQDSLLLLNKSNNNNNNISKILDTSTTNKENIKLENNKDIMYNNIDKDINLSNKDIKESSKISNTKSSNLENNIKKSILADINLENSNIIKDNKFDNVLEKYDKCENIIDINQNEINDNKFLDKVYKIINKVKDNKPYIENNNLDYSKQTNNNLNLEKANIEVKNNPNINNTNNLINNTFTKKELSNVNSVNNFDDCYRSYFNSIFDLYSINPYIFCNFQNILGNSNNSDNIKRSNEINDKNSNTINFNKTKDFDEIKNGFLKNKTYNVFSNFAKTKISSFDCIVPDRNEQFNIPTSIFNKKQSINLNEMKLEHLLSEEKRNRSIVELQYNKVNNLNIQLEQKIRKMKNYETENAELVKIKIDNECKYDELEKELKNVINDYEYKCKLIENRVIERESKYENIKILEIERKYKAIIVELQADIKDRDIEIQNITKFKETLENELAKAKANSIAKLENNDKLKELQYENFLLNEKFNDLNIKYTKLFQDKEKLQRNLFEKEMLAFEKKEINEKNSNTLENIKKQTNINSYNYLTEFNSKNSINVFEKLISDNINNNCQTYENRCINNLSIFEQLNIDREQNMLENLNRALQQEIKELTKELDNLKNINKQSVLFDNNKTCKNNSNILNKEAKEKLNILKNYLCELNLDFEDLNKEYNKLSLNLTNSSFKNDGEIDLETLIILFSNLKIPISKNDIIEIFNNFRKIKNSKNFYNSSAIYFNDFINSIKYNDSSLYFIQSDPSYIKSIENKLVNYEYSIKEKEEKIEILELKLSTLEEELNKVNKNLLIKDKHCIELLNSLEGERKSVQDKLNEITYNINNNNNNLDNLIINSSSNNCKTNNNTDSNIKRNNYFSSNNNTNQLNSLNTTNNNIINQDINLLKAKIEILELELKKEKENHMNTILVNKNNNENSLLKMEIKYKEETSKLLEELNILKKEKEYLIKKYDNEIIDADKKLSKYKKNFSILKLQYDNIEKDKEKLSKFIKDPNSKYTEEIQSLEKKILLLEQNNKEREEKYRQICVNINSYQTNKELKQQAKVFKKEKQDLKNELMLKNKEIFIIKKELNEIIKELEDLKSNKNIKI